MSQVNQEFFYQEELQKERMLDEKINSSWKSLGVKKDLKKKETSRVTTAARFILVLSFIADVFGLIPIAGSFFSMFFGVVLTVLYFFDSMGRGAVNKRVKKIARKIILKLILFVVEFFFSPFPGFTIEALINIYLLKKGYYKRIEIINSKVGKIKKMINRFK